MKLRFEKWEHWTLGGSIEITFLENNQKPPRTFFDQGNRVLTTITIINITCERTCVLLGLHFSSGSRFPQTGLYPSLSRQKDLLRSHICLLPYQVVKLWICSLREEEAPCHFLLPLPQCWHHTQKMSWYFWCLFTQTIRSDSCPLPISVLQDVRETWVGHLVRSQISEPWGKSPGSIYSTWWCWAPRGSWVTGPSGVQPPPGQIKSLFCTEDFPP